MDKMRCKSAKFREISGKFPLKTADLLLNSSVRFELDVILFKVFPKIFNTIIFFILKKERKIPSKETR